MLASADAASVNAASVNAASVGAGPVPARWPVKGQCVITILSDTGSIEPTGWHGACPYTGGLPSKSFADLRQQICRPSSADLPTFVSRFADLRQQICRPSSAINRIAIWDN